MMCQWQEREDGLPKMHAALQRGFFDIIEHTSALPVQLGVCFEKFGNSTTSLCWF